MLLLIVLAAVVLVGVGAVVAWQGRGRLGPPGRGATGLGGSDSSDGSYWSVPGDDSLPLNLAAGSLVVTEQIQADHAAQSPHHDAHHHDPPHYSPDPAAGAGTEAGWSDSSGGDAGSAGGDP